MGKKKSDLYLISRQMNNEIQVVVATIAFGKSRAIRSDPISDDFALTICRHGNQQARRPLRHPSQLVQVHRRLLPGIGKSRQRRTSGRLYFSENFLFTDSTGILYYRGADGVKLSTMVVSSHSGLEHLCMMMKYAEDIKTCRRVLISRYFDEQFAAAKCAGTCDNCCDPKKINSVDITRHAKTLVEALKKLTSRGGKDDRATVAQVLVDL